MSARIIILKNSLNYAKFVPWYEQLVLTTCLVWTPRTIFSTTIPFKGIHMPIFCIDINIHSDRK